MNKQQKNFRPDEISINILSVAERINTANELDFNR